jgi:hypothetical protein
MHRENVTLPFYLLWSKLYDGVVVLLFLLNHDSVQEPMVDVDVKFENGLVMSSVFSYTEHLKTHRKCSVNIKYASLLQFVYEIVSLH